MLYLFAVSFLWAFSFGLIKGRLAGLDSSAIALLRLMLSALVFLPFLKPKGVAIKTRVWLAVIGAIQFGLMYVLYQESYRYLSGYEVALFTIFTPIFVALFDAALENRFRVGHMIAALLSVIGAGVLTWGRITSHSFLNGFMLIQGANLCFAVGQIAYKRTKPSLQKHKDAALFGWLYLGAVAAALPVSLWRTDWTSFSPSLLQIGVIVYLGILASGIGFFLWNVGATKVNTGTLAVFNNAKVPLGVACSLLFFGEKTKWLPLSVSLVLLIVGLIIAERTAKKS